MAITQGKPRRGPSPLGQRSYGGKSPTTPASASGGGANGGIAMPGQNMMGGSGPPAPGVAVTASGGSVGTLGGGGSTVFGGGGGVQTGGGFGSMPPIPSFGPAPGINMTASTYPALEALQKRYDTYLGGLETNTGQIMDQAGARLRDAQEGGKRSLQQTQGLRGVASSPADARYEADTQRGVQGAISDIATERERTLGAALQGGLGIARGPADLALAEKGLGINAYQAQNAAQMGQFNAWLALLNAQRNSPLNQPYTGGF